VNGDHPALARAIERLADEPELRGQLSEACYARLSDEQMDHRKVIARWIERMEAARKRAS
jgi:glycosyltransferase involved in cell wall biosynthesis